MTKQEANDMINSGEVGYCCPDCASKYRFDYDKPYDGIYTMFTGICQLCNTEKSITSARKLFGKHRFI